MQHPSVWPAGTAAAARLAPGVHKGMCWLLTAVGWEWGCGSVPPGLAQSLHQTHPWFVAAGSRLQLAKHLPSAGQVSIKCDAMQVFTGALQT